MCVIECPKDIISGTVRSASLQWHMGASAGSARHGMHACMPRCVVRVCAGVHAANCTDMHDVVR